MWYYVVKVAVSAGLIVAVSELSKRSTIAGGLLASLPLVSVLGIAWLWIDTGDAERISRLSWDIFWLVIPSLAFFVVLPLLLERGAPFALSMLSAAVATILCYGATLAVMQMAKGS